MSGCINIRKIDDHVKLDYMSRQTIYTCDRCGKQFTEGCLNDEFRISMRADYHWNDVSTGHHLKEHFFDLCDKCSKAFTTFMAKNLPLNLIEDE